MSHHDYRVSRDLLAGDPPFAALVMAAMRKADTGNARALATVYPAIWVELRERYDAPGGVLATDPNAVETLARAINPEAFDPTHIDAHPGEELFRQHQRNSARAAARERLGLDTETAAP